MCKPCRVESDEGPEARRLYLKQIASKGAQASKAKRGQHALRVDDLPPVIDHASAKAWLQALVRGVASGRMSRSLAAETRKIIKFWLQAHRQEVTDKQFAELSDQIAALRERAERGSEPWR